MPRRENQTLRGRSALGRSAPSPLGFRVLMTIRKTVSTTVGFPAFYAKRGLALS
jgi:hypothetical protein